MPRDAIGNGAPRIADLITKRNCSTKRASRDVAYPGEIISERRARSNRNAGRQYPGFAGDFPRNSQGLLRRRPIHLTFILARRLALLELLLEWTERLISRATNGADQSDAVLD